MWNDFFFSTQDLGTIALFRILFGTLLVCDAISRISSARHFLYPDGIFPIERHRSEVGRWRPSLFSILPPVAATAQLIALAYLLSAIAVTLGFLMPFSTVAAFISLTSIQQRNKWVLNSGDSVMLLMCFLLIFSSAGKAYSLDSLWSGSNQQTASIWPVRLMQIQIAAVYAHAVRWKIRGRSWRNGEAAYYTLNLLTHQRKELPALLRRPLVLRAFGYATLAIEFSLAFLIWIPAIRNWVLGAGILFHASLTYFMRMHLFQWAMIVSLLIFIDPNDARSVLGAVGGLFGG